MTSLARMTQCTHVITWHKGHDTNNKFGAYGTKFTVLHRFRNIALLHSNVQCTSHVQCTIGRQRVSGVVGKYQLNAIFHHMFAAVQSEEKFACHCTKPCAYFSGYTGFVCPLFGLAYKPTKSKMSPSTVGNFPVLCPGRWYNLNIIN